MYWIFKMQKQHWLWFGVGERRNIQRMVENDLTCRIQHWLFFFFCDAPANKCPRHLSKVQCSNALLTEFDAPGIWKFHAPGTTDGYCAVFGSTVAVIPRSLGSWPQGQGLQGSSHLQGRFPLARTNFFRCLCHLITTNVPCC